VIKIIESIDGGGVQWILVDNGSTDEITNKVLNESSMVNLVNLEKNLGFGGGIKAGLRTATSDFIAWMPGNLKVHPLAPKMLLDRFELENGPRTDFVLIKSLRVARGVIPQIKTRGSSLLVSIFGRMMLKDIGGTPTVVTRNCLESLMDTPDDYSFELAAYYNLRKKGCTEFRFPSVYSTRIYGQTHWQFGLKPELSLLSSQIKYVLASRAKSIMENG